jgi:hypothetical protein
MDAGKILPTGAGAIRGSTWFFEAGTGRKIGNVADARLAAPGLLW